MAAAHVPAGTGFATKPALALTMIERALEAETCPSPGSPPIASMKAIGVLAVIPQTDGVNGVCAGSCKLRYCPMDCHTVPRLGQRFVIPERQSLIRSKKSACMSTYCLFAKRMNKVNRSQILTRYQAAVTLSSLDKVAPAHHEMPV
jgi:hypothetical protein